MTLRRPSPHYKHFNTDHKNSNFHAISVYWYRKDNKFMSCYLFIFFQQLTFMKHIFYTLLIQVIVIEQTLCSNWMSIFTRRTTTIKNNHNYICFPVEPGSDIPINFLLPVIPLSNLYKLLLSKLVRFLTYKNLKTVSGILWLYRLYTIPVSQTTVLSTRDQKGWNEVARLSGQSQVTGRPS